MRTLKIKTVLGKAFGLMLLSLTSFSLVAQDGKLSDADIAHAGVTANQIDIDYAEIAIKQSSNKEIVNFAKTMKEDHKSVIEQATALVTKLHVTPTDNAVSKSLIAGAEKKKAELKKLKGNAFDKAYINNEVEYHKAVIGALKTVLIPQAKNQELKAFLEALLPALETHLHHAEMVQKQIK